MTPYNLEPHTTIGLLTLVKASGNLTRKGEILWECQCICGKTIVLSAALLRNGKQKDCGCGRIAYERGATAFDRLLSMYKHKAKREGLPWELTVSELKDILTQPCSYCNSKPRREFVVNFTTILQGLSYIKLKTSGIGYTTANTTPACRKCLGTRPKNLPKTAWIGDDELLYIDEETKETIEIDSLEEGRE